MYVSVEKTEDAFLRILKERQREVLEDTIQCVVLKEAVGPMEYNAFGEECVAYVKKLENETPNKESLKLTFKSNVGEIIKDAVLLFEPRKELTKVILIIYW